jgi:hypothetical protein
MHLKSLQHCLLLYIILLSPGTVFSQEHDVQLLGHNKPASGDLASYLKKGEVVVFKQELSRSLKSRISGSIQFAFLFENREWVLELEKSKIVSEGFFITTGSVPGGKFRDNGEALHYRGKIRGKPGSFAAVSILHDQVVGIIADERGNINIGAINTTSARLAHEHIIYRDEDLLVKNDFHCSPPYPTDAAVSNYPIPVYNRTNSVSGVVNDEPVDIYVEADYQTYLNNGSSVPNVVNYVTALFNVVNGVFLNDSVNTKLSAVKVWDVPDPYQTFTDKVSALGAFSSNMANGFPGDLAHFITQRNVGGAAAYLDVICRRMSSRVALSGAISNSFNPFPIYSYSVWVISHELGHNLGSPHTQSCSWPGGAIDNCFTPEGSCAVGPAPINGGTIMSYCQDTPYGINLSLGFGHFPAALIRNTVRASSCIFPSLYFDIVSQVAREENADIEGGCFDYKVHTVNLRITTPPSQAVAVTLIPTSPSPGLVMGTNKDVEIGSPLTFSIDSNNLIQTIDLKVYNDQVQEPLERLDLNFDINPNGGNAVKMGTSIASSLFIISDDLKPDSSLNQPLFHESFDNITAGTGNWTQTIVYGTGSPNRWVVKNTAGADFSGNAAFVSSDGIVPGYSNDSTILRLESPAMSTAGFSNMTIGCWMKCIGEYYYDPVLNSGFSRDFGRVVFSVDGGATWASVRSDIMNYTNRNFYSFTMPATANNSTQFKIGFEWYNNSSIVNAPPLIIDSIVIKGTSTCPIQTTSHAGNITEGYVGPGQVVHFYNPVTKNIMATVENNSVIDLGCTKIEIIRTGQGATQSGGLLAGELVADKVYKVTTSGTDPSAAYTLKLYYTDSEIQGWIAATGNTAAEVQMVKTNGDLTSGSPASSAMFSSLNAKANFGATGHTVLSSTFTGVTPVATYGIMKPYGPAGCPANSFNYTTDIAGTSYQWQVNVGTGYANIANDAVYNNTNTASLLIVSPGGILFGNRYRCEVTTAAAVVYSQEFILKSGVNWVGTASNAWENALNWSCGVVPDENTDVIINGGTSFSPHLNTNAEIRSLTLGTGSDLIIKPGAVLTLNH